MHKALPGLEGQVLRCTQGKTVNEAQFRAAAS